MSQSAYFHNLRFKRTPTPKAMNTALGFAEYVSNFRLPRLRPRLCIRPCIFYHIPEFRGLCFRRCVHIVCGLFKVLFCSRTRSLRICFVLPRSSLAHPSASLEKNSPIPPSSSTANWKTRQAPGTSSEPYLIPVLADPRKLVQALDTLRSLKSFPSPAPLTPPPARNSPSTFPPPSAPNLREITHSLKCSGPRT
jgi:hypothetical protein